MLIATSDSWLSTVLPKSEEIDFGSLKGVNLHYGNVGLHEDDLLKLIHDKMKRIEGIFDVIRGQVLLNLAGGTRDERTQAFAHKIGYGGYINIDAALPRGISTTTYENMGVAQIGGNIFSILKHIRGNTVDVCARNIAVNISSDDENASLAYFIDHVTRPGGIVYDQDTGVSQWILRYLPNFTLLRGEGGILSTNIFQKEDETGNVPQLPARR